MSIPFTKNYLKNYYFMNNYPVIVWLVFFFVKIICNIDELVFVADNACRRIFDLVFFRYVSRSGYFRL